MKSQWAIQDRRKRSVLPARSFLQHTAVQAVADHFPQPEPATVTGSHFGQDFSQVAAHAASDAGRSEFAPPCPVTPTRCPFGGACNTCPVQVQTRLAINQPGDEYEQEADRLADQLTGTSGAELQCRATGEVGFTEMPSIVHEVLRSPGQPLDPSTRAYVEPRFGHDFAAVRVHTDAQAAESARGVSALAYTVGEDVIFANGQYQPATRYGQHLLMHELVHVVQQRNLPHDTEQLAVTAPDSPIEQEADRCVAGVLQDRRPQLSLGTVSRQAVARQPVPVPMPPPLVRPPVRPQLRVIPGGKLPEVEERLGGEVESEMSLEQLMARAQRARDREQAIWELERPIATLERGGSPPTFVTDEGEGQVIGSWGMARYRRRALHILDAIEYQVGRANTEEDLNFVLQRCIPSWRAPSLRHWQLPLPTFFPNDVVIPRDLDPDGTIRLRVYAAALTRRTRQAPSLGRARARPLEAPSEARRRGCTVEPAAERGGDPLASMFCQMVTGSLFEYKVTSPTMGSVTFDAMVGNTVYECKCGYGSLLRSLNLGRFWAQMRADKLDEQMLRQQRVAADCGLAYRYMVSNRKLAEVLRSRWPSVAVIEAPWAPCD